jgi:hypothetical protein
MMPSHTFLVTTTTLIDTRSTLQSTSLKQNALGVHNNEKIPRAATVHGPVLDHLRSCVTLDFIFPSENNIGTQFWNDDTNAIRVHFVKRSTASFLDKDKNFPHNRKEPE